MTSLESERLRRLQHDTFLSVDSPTATEVELEKFQKFLEKRCGLDRRVCKVVDAELNAVCGDSDVVEWPKLKNFVEANPTR